MFSSVIVGSYSGTFVLVSIIPLLIGFLAISVNCELQSKFMLETRQVLLKRDFAEVFENPQISQENFDYFRKETKEVLGIEMDPNESESSFFRRLAQILEVKPMGTEIKPDDLPYIHLDEENKTKNK